MLNRTLSSLRRSADGAGVLAVGGVLTLLTWVVTPLWLVGVVAFPFLVALAPLALAPPFVTRGYFVRVLAESVESGNAAGAPPFVAWNKLYRDGVKSAVLSAVLLAPLALLFGLVAVAGVLFSTGAVPAEMIGNSVERALGDGGVIAVVGLGGGLLGVVSLAYLLVFAYVRPAALAAFAVSGRLRDGLRPKRVSRIAGSGAYATAWVVAAVTLLTGYALAAPFVPVLIGIVITFVTRVVVYALYGRGSGAVASDETETSDDGGSTAFDTPTDGSSAERVDGNPTEPLARKRPAPEAPPTVQTGRAVPFGDDLGRLVSDGVGGGADDGVSDGIDGGETERFEWSTAIDDAPPVENDSVSTRSDDSDGSGFDWGPSGNEREDKS